MKGTAELRPLSSLGCLMFVPFHAGTGSAEKVGGVWIICRTGPNSQRAFQRAQTCDPPPVSTRRAENLFSVLPHSRPSLLAAATSEGTLAFHGFRPFIPHTPSRLSWGPHSGQDGAVAASPAEPIWEHPHSGHAPARQPSRPSFSPISSTESRKSKPCVTQYLGYVACSTYRIG